MGKSKLYLTPADDGMTLSREEYAEADCKPPWRYERAQGRLVVMVPPGHDHYTTGEAFKEQLYYYKLTHRGVIDHIFDESWASVDEDTDRRPDIAVYLVGGSGRVPQRVPDLIYEIVSGDARDRQRDYVEKREEYERMGVREYVIVDRFSHTVTVLRLGDDGYDESTFEPDDVYSTPLLPGLGNLLGGYHLRKDIGSSC